MAIYREDFVDIELTKGTIHRSFCNRAIGEGDQLANRFGVRLLRNGEPEPISGSCAGYFIRPDGDTVVITGEVEGNTAYVDLPQACYTYEGQFAMAIKVTSGDATGTMRIIDGVVANTTTDTLVDPGTIIPSIEELLDEIEAAVATIPLDYSALSNGFRNSMEAEFGSSHPGSWTDYTIKKSDGTTAGSTVYKITGFMKITGKNVIYTTSPAVNSTVLSQRASIAFYSSDSAAGYISSEDIQSGEPQTIVWQSSVVPEGAKYMRIMIGNTLTDQFKCIQVPRFADAVSGVVAPIVNAEVIPMTPGKYIDLSGSTVTMINGEPALTGNSFGYNVGRMPCAAGDVFTINGHGGSTTRLWGFVDSSGNILSVSPAYTRKSGFIVQAPTGAAWIITNDNDGVNSYKGFMYDQNWPYNTVDVMNYLPKTSGTASTVTFTWTGNTCVVNGTPTGNAWNFLINDANDPVPPMIKPGEKYYLHFEQGGGGNVAFAIVWKTNGSAIRRDYCYNDTEITAPSAFDTVSIALVVFNGHTASSETITCRLFSVSGATKVLDSDVAEMKEALKDIMPRNVLLDFGNFANVESHGVTFTWSADHENCVVDGTADSAYAFDFIWIYTDGLPEDIKPGRQYNLIFTSSDENKVAAHIYYLLPEEEVTSTRYFSDATITIPDNCVGITVRLDVANGVACENVAVKLQLMSIGVETVSGGVANHVSKMFSIGSSAMTGWIYKHNEETGTAKFDHVCSFDNSPYGNVAIGLGIEQEHVTHILMESTGFLQVIYQSKGNILNRLLATDLSPYDYVLTLINRPDLGIYNGQGFPLGDLDSPASDTTIVGGVKTLLNYMRTNAPNTTLILVGPPPSAQGEEFRGQYVFTAKYKNGKSIGEVDEMLHRLAVQEHFIFIDWEDLNLSYWYYTLCDDGNVHPRDDATVRTMGMYLARQCNYTTSIVKAMKADLEG